ncbi:hypothetical protein GWI33_011887, partial [Rhynchophorus ferrugineus]
LVRRKDKTAERIKYKPLKCSLVRRQGASIHIFQQEAAEGSDEWFPNCKQCGNEEFDSGFTTFQAKYSATCLNIK